MWTIGFSGSTIISLLIVAATYGAVPLALDKIRDLWAIVGHDTRPRIEASRPLPNPFLSTG